MPCPRALLPTGSGLPVFNARGGGKTKLNAMQNGVTATSDIQTSASEIKQPLNVVTVLKALGSNRNLLEEKGRFSVVVRNKRNASSQFPDERKRVDELTVPRVSKDIG